MTIQRILPASRYSEAVIVNSLIFCAGMVPSTTSSNATLQTEDVLAQIDALLAQCGSDKTKLVDATIYLADMADYAAMNLAWDNWVAPGQAPARATVEAKLADPGWKIEIKIIAAQ
ncbi:Enamine deaminase RidA, house cleaning of reactive enamine intermediates, YjgF/YER057c/UK114 family [Rheinheimera pacifica]|uniref:Enamine deaminase RidA, house cleaning of reactive enamine intermediates, YjgF/YER057c/UK114 family n=1 Tax=Rheinheimera pacifica TaxID=173990 RepID=A0A1H6JZS7_9GAMM|nr:RidA family protein [Rheinheimera pacifica]SEH66505.1 Enamine deaminase RidA, house cleaning of reactive enamine intermediates, YjgF/YER057c/UK114 family [Rheinheimera pacifica]